MPELLDGDGDGESDDAGEEYSDSRKKFAGSRMLTLLKLKSMLKPSADLRQVLELSAELLGLNPDEIRDKEAFPLPSRRQMDNSFIKLDLCMMMWSQHL